MIWLAVAMLAVAFFMAYHGALIAFTEDPAGVAWCVAAVVLSALAFGLILVATL